LNVKSHKYKLLTHVPTYLEKILRHTQRFTEHETNLMYKLSTVRPFKVQWLLYVPPALILQTILCVCPRACVTIRDSSVGTVTERSCGLRRCTCRPYRLALWPTQHLARFCSVGAKFSVPVQTEPGVHPVSYIVGTGSFPGVKRPGRCVDQPPI
jgi:hypothetical protein